MLLQDGAAAEAGASSSAEAQGSDAAAPPQGQEDDAGLFDDCDEPVGSDGRGLEEIQDPGMFIHDSEEDEELEAIGHDPRWLAEKRPTQLQVRF